MRRDKERGIKPKTSAESSFDENEWMMTNLKRIYGEAGAWNRRVNENKQKI